MSVMEFEDVGYIYFKTLFLHLHGDAEGSHKREWIPARLIIEPSPYRVHSRTLPLPSGFCRLLGRPVTVAERFRACTRTVFAHSEAGIVGSNPTQGKDVWYVYEFILCLCCPVVR
jgi:hypothetical protein